MAGDGLAEIMVNFVLPPNAGINGISPKSLLLTQRGRYLCFLC
jgi:hypothetical protein